MEDWKPIIGYEGLYEVSSLGKVKSINYNHTNTSKILSNAINKKGYSHVFICKLGKGYNLNIHRIVALHFMPNPDNLPFVCHKDETLDENGALYNGVDNLFWGTHSDNMKDMIIKGRGNTLFIANNPSKGKLGKDHFNSKTVYQYTKEGIFIKKWYSMADIKRKLSIHIGHVSECCKGKAKTAGGFIWKFKFK